MDDETVARCLALQLGLAFAPAPLPLDADATGLISADMARERRVLPLGRGDRSLRLGMADPLDLETVDDVQFRTGRRVEPVVVSPSAVLRGQEIAYGPDPARQTLGRPKDGVVTPKARRALEKAAGAAP
ncbi:MAG: hypothetical protein GWN85_10110, partial [Gemmatimonadetes bacterium]|nr:hypothetical protein [Gemmatimonadota bacterium]NIR35234.1 hypothetical protein [Actinomycetota bacterium]NIW26525.1 hypothetical protein [Actinomycetota bacterium]NIX19096.1 hypothetical protein [Actinomycetota bacterium]